MAAAFLQQWSAVSCLESSAVKYVSTFFESLEPLSALIGRAERMKRGTSPVTSRRVCKVVRHGIEVTTNHDREQAHAVVCYSPLARKHNRSLVTLLHHDCRRRSVVFAAVFAFQDVAVLARRIVNRLHLPELRTSISAWKIEHTTFKKADWVGLAPTCSHAHAGTYVSQ